ncbi:hypothetical protein HGM15179_017630 [Zosterops borbonicus]|uniref:LRRC37A/B like protein 1 C-terminal domain-containing protein n=1 Tax=Zosterops borbonicus TaxID=364589 RepID=A0A8K1G0G6_9PASS|nr:hypothetical protein HGM15179_017630 [Zosterops borbonicus]
MKVHHTALVQTRGEIMDMEQGRELNSSPLLSLKPKEPSLGDRGTVTLAVSLTLSTEGDISSLDNSRTNSYPPQHLLGHRGRTSRGGLRAKLKKKLHKSKSIKTAKSIVPHQLQPARLKDVEEKTPSSVHQGEMESRLNWQGLQPSHRAGVLSPYDDGSITGHHRVEEVPAPRKNSIRTHKRRKEEDNQYWLGHNQLFYQVWRPENVDRKPRADQGLNRNLDFLSDPLVQSLSAMSSRGRAMKEEQHSSLGRHIRIMPDKTEEAHSMRLKEPGIPQSPDLAPVPKEPLETTADHHRPSQEPDKGLQVFMAHVEQALRMDCSLPQLKQACAKMVLKTRLLLKVLREREENQGASDPMEQCRLQENMIIHMALGEGKKLRRKKLEALVYVITFVGLLFFFIIVFLILKCVYHVKRCCTCCSAPGPNLLVHFPWLSVKLPQAWRNNKYREAKDAEQDLPELSEAELLLVQYIMDVLDKEEEELQKQMQKEKTDVSQGRETM